MKPRGVEQGNALFLGQPLFTNVDFSATSAAFSTASGGSCELNSPDNDRSVNHIDAAGRWNDQKNRQALVRSWLSNEEMTVEMG